MKRPIFYDDKGIVINSLKKMEELSDVFCSLPLNVFVWSKSNVEKPLIKSNVIYSMKDALDLFEKLKNTFTDNDISYEPINCETNIELEKGIYFEELINSNNVYKLFDNDNNSIIMYGVIDDIRRYVKGRIADFTNTENTNNMYGFIVEDVDSDKELLKYLKEDQTELELIYTINK